PGEAHGAQGAGRFAAGAEAAGRYAPSTTRGRAGPRASRFAFGAIVATVLVTGGLWAGQGVLMEMGVLAPPAAVDAPAPAPEAPPVAPPAPAPEPEPVSAPDAAPAPDVPAPAAPSPPPAPPPARDDRAALDALDRCASEFVRLCPNAPSGAPPGFGGDGLLSRPEQVFLSALRFSTERPVSAETAAACTARVQEAAASRRRTSGSLLATACAGVAWPQSPPAAAQPQSQPQPQRQTQSQPNPPPRAAPPAANVTADLDACANTLAAACPAPRPTSGFSRDGRMSRQESSLLSAVAANAVTPDDQLAVCRGAVSVLGAARGELRSMAGFYAQCRALAPAPAQTLRRVIDLIPTPPPVVSRAPEPAPTPPRVIDQIATPPPVVSRAPTPAPTPPRVIDQIATPPPVVSRAPAANPSVVVSPNVTQRPATAINRTANQPAIAPVARQPSSAINRAGTTAVIQERPPTEPKVN
ncbi:MAG: hypothetical protein NW200_05840, partial [Hyphomonadaceae bacterium]|nr:hypothetical protein [Hyphomonadaceae bacterium]